MPPGTSPDAWASKCSVSLEQLFKALDALDVVYFPRAGTELAFVRGGVVKDTDIDVFVDFPSAKLLQALKPLMRNIGKLYAEGSGLSQELHWKSPCFLEVHMIFNGTYVSLLGRHSHVLNIHVRVTVARLDSATASTTAPIVPTYPQRAVPMQIRSVSNALVSQIRA